MNKLFLTTVLLLLSANVFSQKMTLTKLNDIFLKVTDDVEKKNSKWTFSINEISFIAIADATYNRMRIISPIVPITKLSEELKTAALIANFHTALDIKYAITNDILCAVFIHPLKELSEKQVMDAVSQIYYGNVNFGTSFSSTSLIFPSKKIERKLVEEKEQPKIIQKI